MRFLLRARDPQPELPLTNMGGFGSGNWGHSGRPGKRGGSAPRGFGHKAAATIKDILGLAATPQYQPWGKQPVHKPMPPKKWLSAGTVTFDSEGRVAIVKPKGGFGGYKGFVLPKGTIDDGETAEDAAKRETAEEAGHESEIVESLGTHEGTSSHTTYFLAEYKGPAQTKPDNESEEIRWATPSEAAHLLDSVRDLRVLVLAIEARRRRSEKA